MLNPAVTNIVQPYGNRDQWRDGQQDVPSAYNMLCLYAPQALVADYFFQELHTHFSWAKIKQAVHDLFHSREEAADLRDRVEATLGVELPISYDAVPAMMEEVRRFQWLEAERHGRDIWAEQHPTDPEAHALRTWFVKHFGGWYLARKQQRARA